MRIIFLHEREVYCLKGLCKNIRHFFGGFHTVRSHSNTEEMCKILSKTTFGCSYSWDVSISFAHLHPNIFTHFSR